MPLIATNVLVPASSATLGAAAEVTDLWEDRLVQNQFMDEVVAVGAGDYLCAASEKNKSGNPFTPTLRCFSATSAFSPVDLTVEMVDQYGRFEHTIGSLVELCVPAIKGAAG